MQKQAVLLMSHFFNTFIEEKYNRIKEELSIEEYDVFLLLNLNNKAEANKIPPYINLRTYDIHDLNSLGYIPIFETILPGSCHFPVLRFYLERPNYYSFYWFVEYDVEFTAPWSLLLNAYQTDKTDYIVPFLAKYDTNKNRGWLWWTEANNSGYPIKDSLRAFHPICRYSARSLRILDEYLREGHSAHSELLIPTCLSHAGLTLKTFDDVFFIREKGFNSFRFRPVFFSEEIKQKKVYGKLYHPVKA